MLALAPALAAAKGNAWSRFRGPTGVAESLGSYASGCLLGGTALPDRAPGFETVRRHRRRFFGHPVLARFLFGYGQRVQRTGLGAVLIGDISQARGGPMPSGHRSHQMGLDADVWFTTPPPRSRARDEDFLSLVDGSERIERSVFGRRHIELLRAAAEAPEVARVFVGWVIKRELCKVVEGDRSWLRKIRPWWGHTRHFHVRLRCPPGSPQCRDQKEPAAGDGCGQEVWFSRAAVAKRAKKKSKKKKKARRTLPERCRALLK